MEQRQKDSNEVLFEDEANGSPSTISNDNDSFITKDDRDEDLQNNDYSDNPVTDSDHISTEDADSQQIVDSNNEIEDEQILESDAEDVSIDSGVVPDSSEKELDLLEQEPEPEQESESEKDGEEEEEEEEKKEEKEPKVEPVTESKNSNIKDRTIYPSSIKGRTTYSTVLYKPGKYIKKLWKKRYYFLDTTNGSIYYVRGPASVKVKGTFVLDSSSTILDRGEIDKRKGRSLYIFYIRCGGKSYKVATDNIEDKKKLIDSIQGTISRIKGVGKHD